ncbi:MAG: efflux RND transporter periplasmic adaptor subunit [Saprospiraceae bacterium]|nr:efflux RND transporter periplasmic adaptor subunit [Saprospiraceae bacterium]MCB9324468.1 efflux RND transporter periplasmic adaptor subunit [Lewinellaceae bacterium]
MKKFIIIAVAITAALSSCRQEADHQDEKTGNGPDLTQYVKMVNVAVETNAQTIDVLGIIVSKTQSTPAFKTGGVIEKTFVKEGDRVSKGQLIATLIMTEINAGVAQAEEGLAKATRDLERAENLYADSVATLEQLQNAQTGVMLASKNLEIARFNKKHSEVRAPIKGRVIKQLLHEGEVAGPGLPVYAILGVSDNDWKVNANLIDRDWAKLKVGDPVNLVLDAYPGQKFKGQVSEKSVIATDASGSLEVEFSFMTPPPSLAAGMVCRVETTPHDLETMTIIPIEAIVKSNGHTATVFTVEDGKAKKLEINILELLGSRVAISGGLENVKEVVTIGAMFLEDGDTVVAMNQLPKN